MKRKSLYVLLAAFIICFSFNAFAMTEKINGEFVPASPENEEKHEDRDLNFRWTWLNDDLCVRFNVSETWRKENIQKLADNGLIGKWAVSDESGARKLKNRAIYTGKWNQAEDGVWSFVFDDCTIPVGLTKIDDVIYAFNTFGELKEGYKYWNDYETTADGIATCQDPEYLLWLETQYLPACTSHE